MNKPALLRRTSSCFLLSAVFFYVASGCKKTEEVVPEASVMVQAVHPSVGPISEEIVADAILAPLSQAAISPRISAPVAAEYVQRGAHVHRGQLLLTLEDRDLRGNALDSMGAVTAAKAGFATTTQATIPEELEKARADAAQAKVALEVAHKTTEERQSLYEQGALAGHDFDIAVAAEAQARAVYETAQKHEQAEIQTVRVTNKDAAQGQLTSAQGRLENAEAQVSYAALRSPIDGVVTERPLFPGETATAGTPAIILMDTSSLLAKLHIAQASAQQLALGHTAKVSVPELQGPIDATVSFISPTLDPGSTTVEVWLRLPNPDGRFKVGTPVHAVITGRTIKDALQVPASAIVPGRDGGTAVMLVSSDGTAHRKPVTVGVRTEETVQILSNLSPSDTVITEGGYGLDEGTKITIGKRDDEDDSSSEQGKGNN